MKRFMVGTSLGPVAFEGETPTPQILLFHGFKRGPAFLRDWLARFDGVGLAILPGHAGLEPLAETSVGAWTQAWREALPLIGPPPVLIGESLGGLVAMGLPARAVVALEPPLSVEGAWPIGRMLTAAPRQGIEISAADRELFAVPYHQVLDRLSAPTLLLAGDLALHPQRPLPVAPSLLSDEDFARLSAHPLVSAARIGGGHALLDQNPDEVVRRVNAFLADTLSR